MELARTLREHRSDTSGATPIGPLRASSAVKAAGRRMKRAGKLILRSWSPWLKFYDSCYGSMHALRRMCFPRETWPRSETSSGGAPYSPPGTVLWIDGSWGRRFFGKTDRQEIWKSVPGGRTTPGYTSFRAASASARDNNGSLRRSGRYGHIPARRSDRT
jgi:hypothetical protein